jgi:hypothetical protein
MPNITLNKLVLLSASLIAATFAVGCVVGKAPVEPPGQTVTDGALTWYVSASKGSTYGDGTSLSTSFNTLQQAEAVALPGDIIQVDNGTYTNNGGPVLDITIPGSATGGYITWEPIPGANPVIQIGADAYAAVQFESTAAYTIFQGFTVLGYNKSLSLAEGVACEGNNGVESQCIQNNGGCISINGDITTTQQTGAVEPNHIEILNNTVAYCGGGIGSAGGDYITFSGNTVYDNAWYTIYGASAISMLGSYDTNPTDTTTQYKMQITNNTIYGNAEFIPWIAQGVITDGEGIILDSNLNSAYVGAGLNYPTYSGRFLVANNIIWNDGSSAIEVFESAHADVVNNSTFNDNLNQDASEAGRGEMSISGGSYDVNIFNNVFYSSTAGTATPLAAFGGVSNVNADYNIYYAGLPNNWNGLGANGPHDQVIDPMYTATPTPTLSGGGIGTSTYQPTDVINAATPNLMLLSGSPAIGAGTASFKGYPAPPKDILGNARPSANGYTLGAYSQ